MMMQYQHDTHLTYQCRAAATLSCVKDCYSRLGKSQKRELSLLPPLPKITLERRLQALDEAHKDIPTHDEKHGKPDTFLYLAYGSNLSNETFRGNRGIKPLAQMNVQVPELRLTFDLPGIAYSEPCFANSGRRDPDKDVPEESSQDYHKDRWHKGMIGVVYEVTPSDYAHIIATEGGGSSYHDVLVDCYPFASSDPSAPVPQFPTTKPFKAHTLFAPATLPGEEPPKDGGRFHRPDTSYAQPSTRYMKLITDGAAECQLPYEYQDYLKQIRPYTITSAKQRVGQFVFMTLWFPLIMFIFGMQRDFSDDQGVAPSWLRLLSGALFQTCWASYDNYFKDLFGEGERTVPADQETEPKRERKTLSQRKTTSQRKTWSQWLWLRPERPVTEDEKRLLEV